MATQNRKTTKPKGQQTVSKSIGKTYQDDKGNPILLEAELARGGEGSVHTVKGNPNVVAKIYLPKAMQKHDKTEKIKAMCDLYDQDIAKFSALPEKAIYNSLGKVVGFIMQKVSNFKEIHNLYGISTKRKMFSNADWGFMVHAAKNLACAVDTLHSKNIVIGDINQGNILVDNQAMIKLIDCDSYQVEYNGQFYLCEVGVPEYTSPELQGMSFNGVHRTKNHDCFGLAVMIFKILMFGRHPYSGVGAPPEIENSIKQGYYCFGKNAKNNTPIYSQLASELLSDEIKELFERAFSKNYNSVRPTPEEWINALDNLENSLVQCSHNHKFYNNGHKCIWCELAKMGFNPFGNPVNKNNLPKQKPNYKQTPYNPNGGISTGNNPKTQPQNNYLPPTPQQQKQPYSTSIAQTSNNINWKLILGIIVAILIIGALNSNNEINNTISNTPTSNIAQEQIHYSDAEREHDLRNYKDYFLQILQQNYKSQLNKNTTIDKNILAEITINKNGIVELGNIVSAGRVNPIVKDAILHSLSHHGENELSFEPLPESYNSDKLKLKFVFTKTGVYYKGEEPQESISDKEIAVQENNEQQIKNELKTQNIEKPQNYTDSGAYLTNVKNILNKNFNTTYSVDCIVKFTPPDDVKILKDKWNGDVAYNILLNTNIPKFYDSNGNIKPLIINFSGHSIASVAFETPVHNTLKSPTTNTKASKTNNTYGVVVGKYMNKEQAEVAKGILQDSGLDITPVVKNVGNYYTIQVGSYSTRERAKQAADTLIKNSFPATVE